jgi:nitrite reductase/ring-hydroxylating ferredoxin subunit
MAEIRKLSRPEFVKKLEGEGLRFSDLVLTSEGEYAADDSDWNYKDIPHLHHVHMLAEAYPAVIGDDVICSINMQSILGIWFPVTLVNYELAKYQQVYYTTLFFFALVIETNTVEYEPLKTRVTTTYSIGAPKWLYWAIPIIKKLIQHNYKDLMSTDIPMRQRRGELRKLGYQFHKRGDRYSFIETVDVSGTNVSPPPGKPTRVECDYVAQLATTNDVLVGDTGLLGFRLVRNGDEVSVFPRACPHEGASVEKQDCSSGAVRCPWHGRRLVAIAKFKWLQDTSVATSAYSVTVSGSKLSVEYIGQPTQVKKAA